MSLAGLSVPVSCHFGAIHFVSSRQTETLLSVIFHCQLKIKFVFFLVFFVNALASTNNVQF